ncbi:hypothetical protein D3C79_1113930 [compost metagenome]
MPSYQFGALRGIAVISPMFSASSSHKRKYEVANRSAQARLLTRLARPASVMAARRLL